MKAEQIDNIRHSIEDHGIDETYRIYKKEIDESMAISLLFKAYYVAVKAIDKYVGLRS